MKNINLVLIIAILISFSIGVLVGTKIVKNNDLPRKQIIVEKQEKSKFENEENENKEKREKAEDFSDKRKEEKNNVIVKKEKEEKQSIPEAGFEFLGEGTKTLGPIKLRQGLTIVNLKNQMGPNSLFKAEIFVDENNNGKLDKNEGWTGLGISVGYSQAENFKGSFAFKAQNQNYFVYIQGGRWQVKVNQPSKNISNKENPKKWTGKGYQVTKQFYLPEGEYKFKAKHNGSGNFIIYLIDENGNSTGRLVNVIGKKDIDFNVNNLFTGNYVFEVRADGEWEIEQQ